MSLPRYLKTLVVALAVMGLGLSSGATAAPPTTPTVLFVCQFGTVKSPTARELFKRRASQLGLSVIAKARGITPQEHLSPELATALKNDDIDPKSEPLQTLTPEDIAKADVVVIFDPLPAGIRPAHLVDWTDLPSLNNAYPVARKDLDSRIDQLLTDVAAEH